MKTETSESTVWKFAKFLPLCFLREINFGDFLSGTLIFEGLNLPKLSSLKMCEMENSWIFTENKISGKSWHFRKFRNFQERIKISGEPGHFRKIRRIPDFPQIQKFSKWARRRQSLTFLFWILNFTWNYLIISIFPNVGQMCICCCFFFVLLWK